MSLKLLNGKEAAPEASPIIVGIEAEGHHQALLEGFYQSHRFKGHTERTIARFKQILTGWFDQFGQGQRPLYTWEAMDPVTGRERLRAYAGGLVDLGLSPNTIRSYLLSLNQYFTFVLSYPFVKSQGKSLRIDELYGPIAQPVSEFELPVHCGDAERASPIEPERIHEFLIMLREHYLEAAREKTTNLVRGRNYAMVVLAVESGLRADELTHLHVDDLLFKSHRLQTRFAKGKRGTGKRSRTTLFPPLARDTVRYYQTNYRPHFTNADKSSLLFLSKNGALITSPTLSRITQDFKKCAKTQRFPVLDHLSWHWYRKMFSTRFIERFPNKLPALLEMLGHSKLSTQKPGLMTRSKMY